MNVDDCYYQGASPLSFFAKAFLLFPYPCNSKIFCNRIVGYLFIGKKELSID